MPYTIGDRILGDRRRMLHYHWRRRMPYTIGARILGDRRRMLHTIRTFYRFSVAQHHASSWTT